MNDNSVFDFILHVNSILTLGYLKAVSFLKPNYCMFHETRIENVLCIVNKKSLVVHVSKFKIFRDF